MESDILTNFDIPFNDDAIIKVIGVGGGGSNAVNHMCRKGIKDVDFIICNTDAQALANSPVNTKVQLGSSLTEGRGAGNKPEVGKHAAHENIEDVKKAIGEKTKMVFITAGMGGGTGTGAGPVIAKACRDLDLLTVGIVTLPFRNEGRRRILQAIEGIQEMEAHVDSLLVINNERIREMYGDFRISEAFSKADDILATAAKGIAEIITVHGYINVDFADVETVMRQSGVAIMGSAVATGENRAIDAVQEALNSPLLNNNNINGARNILLNVTSGVNEITMDEIGQITDYVQSRAGFDADLIWGNGADETLGDEIRVTVVATGFSTSSIPEVLANRKVEKTYHTLDDQLAQHAGSAKPDRPLASKTPPPKQESLRFDNGRPSDDFDSLYPNTGNAANVNYNDEPAARKVEFNVDFAGSEEDEIENLEKIPAYKRRLINRKNDQHEDRKVSRFSLSTDENNDIFFSENNTYLHDNVD
ncbi:MAG TPA: cell division protein FtsZ [Prolixibacteraceae bacterium]|nr:cell division protein FtsZ [Prolixibacteraceae bacterium]HPR59520.1 cell division protein FtsZ [Prolixibacteraceae bacterium]